MPGKPKKMTEEQLCEAIELYHRGASLADCAHIYGITRQAMWSRMKGRIQMRPQLRYGSSNHFFRRGPVADAYVHNLTEQAIEDGVIQRSATCETCGASGHMSDGRTIVQAHHCDYNKPLEVLWLCQKCHHEWHKSNIAIAREEVPRELPAVDVICGGFP